MTAAPILQDRLPHIPWTDPRTWRLPGILPCPPDGWLMRDEAFAPQMAERDRLIATRGPSVRALLPEAQAAAAELLAAVLSRLATDPGYAALGGAVQRPDGVRVALDAADPLTTAGRLVQEDLCILQPDGQGEHRLTGAVLCFPASWTLAQKIGRPLGAIHDPVAHYAGDVARRVQRLFDAIRPEQPLMRFNALVYDDPTLHQPRLEGEARPRPVKGLYLRSERQCLLRLPSSGAVVFTIHTFLVPTATLPQAARDAMAAAGL